MRSTIRIGSALLLVLCVSAGTVSCASPAPTSEITAPPATHRPTSPQAGSAAQCVALSNVVLGVAAVANGDPSADRELASLRGLETSAPAEIRPDVVVIADFLGRAVTAVHHHQHPDLKENPALRAALEHEAEWLQKNCPAL